MRSSPPLMALTLRAKSSAYSCRISFAGQTLCTRSVSAPCALTMAGNASPAAADPARNRRRGGRVFAPRALIGLSHFYYGHGGRLGERFAALVGGMPADERQHHQEAHDVR